MINGMVLDVDFLYCFRQNIYKNMERRGRKIVRKEVDSKKEREEQEFKALRVLHKFLKAFHHSVEMEESGSWRTTTGGSYRRPARWWSMPPG